MVARARRDEEQAVMGQDDRLDLVFLATGTWQHVFVHRDDREVGWVYKIPSAFGYLLPFDHPQRLRPRSLPARAVDALLARLPPGERALARHLRRLSLRRSEERRV